MFIPGEDHRILKSKDYGNSWEIINTPVPAWNDVRFIYFYNEDIGFVDRVTNIYKTIDSGLHWNTMDFPFSSFDVIHFYNEMEGFNLVTVTAYEGGDFPTFKGSISYQTYDGGKNWDKSDLTDTIFLGLTCFPERDLGYGMNYSEFCTIRRK